MGGLTIREARGGDAEAIAALILPVFRAGETYTVPRDIDAEAALAFWCAPEKIVFLAEMEEEAIGTSYIRPNAGGGGDHVCNCGYITADAARGRGVARAMLAHSLETARAMGFRAMQFNFVMATNTRAIAIWERAGFETVGRLPRAFRHPKHGFVDALVMWTSLESDA